MPNYLYTVKLSTGKTQKGNIVAHDKSAAINTLRSKQMQPIMIKEASSSVGLGMNITLPGSKVKSRDLVIFTRQFAVMVNAGVPILRSINILKDQSKSIILKTALTEVLTDVQAGANLSDAFAKHKKVFSDIYVSMVRAGETGGILDKVLNNLAFQQEKDASLKAKIKAAMIYPSVIFSATLIAFFVLMTYIVPKIGAMLNALSSGKQQLPIYTRAMLSASHVMKQPAFIFSVIVGLPILFVIFRYYIKTKNGRFVWHTVLLKIPVVNNLITKTAVARFSRIFASLMTAGVSIVDAIETTANAIGNAVIEKDLLNAAKAVQAGSQLSTELEKSKNFPPIVSQMLAVGEETGKTDTIILKIAEFYEEEVDVTVGALSSIIEPIMILLLGGMVGLIAVSVFGPITQTETSVHS
jgi:type IV pilus assembly protein PilC